MFGKFNSWKKWKRQGWTRLCLVIKPRREMSPGLPARAGCSDVRPVADVGGRPWGGLAPWPSGIPDDFLCLGFHSGGTGLLCSVPGPAGVCPHPLLRSPSGSSGRIGEPRCSLHSPLGSRVNVLPSYLSFSCLGDPGRSFSPNPGADASPFPAPAPDSCIPGRHPPNFPPALHHPCFSKPRSCLLLLLSSGLLGGVWFPLGSRWRLPRSCAIFGVGERFQHHLRGFNSEGVMLAVENAAMFAPGALPLALSLLLGAHREGLGTPNPPLAS